MKETFDDYKPILESNLCKFSYLYGGDVVSSKDDSYKFKKTTNTVSPISIIDCFDKIYADSFSGMMEKSKEFVISCDINKINKSDIIKIIGDIGLNFKYLFLSESSIGLFKKIGSDLPFPNYFYKVDTYQNSSIYYSPMIEEEEGEVVVYLSDRPIQSLVYALQNMEYVMNEKNHIIKYKFYECDFNSYKVSFKDLAKLRNDKIDSLIS